MIKYRQLAGGKGRCSTIRFRHDVAQRMVVSTDSEHSILSYPFYKSVWGVLPFIDNTGTHSSHFVYPELLQNASLFFFSFSFFKYSIRPVCTSDSGKFNIAPINAPPPYPRGGGGWVCAGGGISWGFDSQNSLYPQELDIRLWQRGGSLDVSARKSRKKICNINLMGFLTQHCVT